MKCLRPLMIAVLVLLSSGFSAAQRPGPQFRRPLACEPVEPRTKLEALEWRYERVVTKGFTRVANLTLPGISIRIDAVELKDASAPSTARGIVISMRNVDSTENRAYVDYEDIDPLLKALDAVGRVNESITKLVSFEARYRSVGDLEVVVFRQARTGTAATITTGICDRITGHLTLDELETVRAHIAEAKTRLDEANK